MTIIPSADFKDLVRYVKVRNDNALRNALARLGWEDRRVRWSGKQHRVWVRKDVAIENGRVSAPDLAEGLEGAEENGFIWFRLEYFMAATWEVLHARRLRPGAKPDHKAPDLDPENDGANGPFLDSQSPRRYQTWRNDAKALESQKKALLRVED